MLSECLLSPFHSCFPHSVFLWPWHQCFPAVGSRPQGSQTWLAGDSRVVCAGPSVFSIDSAPNSGILWLLGLGAKDEMDMAAGNDRGHSMVLHPKAYSEARGSPMRQRINTATWMPCGWKEDLKDLGEGPMGLATPVLASLSAFFHPCLRRVSGNQSQILDLGLQCPINRGYPDGWASLYPPLILWSCLHFSLCLFYIFITSWGLRVEQSSGVGSLVLSLPWLGWRLRARVDTGCLCVFVGCSLRPLFLMGLAVARHKLALPHLLCPSLRSGPWGQGAATSRCSIAMNGLGQPQPQSGPWPKQRCDRRCPSLSPSFSSSSYLSMAPVPRLCVLL